MTPESVLAAHLINLSHQFVCLYVYPLFVPRQRLGKHISAAKITRKKTKIVKSAVFLNDPSRIKRVSVGWYAYPQF
jgi:hypothetical protein